MIECLRSITGKPNFYCEVVHIGRLDDSSHYKNVCAMNEVFCINPDYSTTRCVTRTSPDLSVASDAKFIPTLTLDSLTKRINEGGLRTEGYFKAGILNASDDIQYQPLVTVITAVFNGAKTLEKTILSVINQSYSNVEFIVIDGGSTDETIEILKKYEHAIDYWVSEPDRGIYDAWNKGVELSQGNWICFLGADDIFWNGKSIQDIVTRLKPLPDDIRVAYAQVMLLNQFGEKICVVGEPWLEIKERFKQVMCIPHQGIMHRRSLFEKHGIFDESFHIAGDYELLLRELLSQDAEFFSSFILTGMQQGGVSSSPQNSIKTLREIRRAQKIHGLNKCGRIWCLALIRSYIRVWLWRIVGKKHIGKVLDVYRRVMNLPPYWTKL